MFSTVMLIFLVFTVDAQVLGNCCQMALWDVNAMRELSLLRNSSYLFRPET